MESAEENQISLDTKSSVLFKKELVDGFSELFYSNPKEVWFGAFNFFLFLSTLIVDDPQLDGVRPAPTHTEGLVGFFEQNMAGSMEVIAMFYIARIPVELVVRGIEILTDKKIDPRIKVGVAVLLAVTFSSALELMKDASGASLHGGVPHELDAWGNLVAGIYVSVGYLVIDQLSKPHETSMIDQLSKKISQLLTSDKISKLAKYF